MVLLPEGLADGSAQTTCIADISTESGSRDKKGAAKFQLFLKQKTKTKNNGTRVAFFVFIAIIFQCQTKQRNSCICTSIPTTLYWMA
jgi:hypothetical protein